MINNYQAKAEIFCERRLAVKILKAIGTAGWVNQSKLTKRLKADDMDNFTVCIYHESLKDKIQSLTDSKLEWK